MQGHTVEIRKNMFSTVDRDIDNYENSQKNLMSRWAVSQRFALECVCAKETAGAGKKSFQLCKEVHVWTDHGTDGCRIGILGRIVKSRELWRAFGKAPSRRPPSDEKPMGARK